MSFRSLHYQNITETEFFKEMVQNESNLQLYLSAQGELRQKNKAGVDAEFETIYKQKADDKLITAEDLDHY